MASPFGTPFGDLPTDEDLPFVERGIAVGRNASSTGGNGSVGLGSFTMPWHGDAYLHMQIVFTWPQNAHMQATMHAGASSPVPGWYPAFNFIGQCLGANLVSQLPVYGYWAGLAKGATINLGLAFYFGNGTGTCTLAMGQMRGVRT
jgi:hypothetical protein